MSDQQIEHKPVRRILGLFVGVLAIGGIVFYLSIWIEGLPGPLRGAYLARGSMSNIYSDLRSFDEANGHLPLPTATDEQTGEQISWRIEVYQSSLHSGFLHERREKSQESLDYDRHKPWNDPANLRLESLGAYLFRYTQVDADPVRHKAKHGYYTTYYKAVTGPDSAWGTGDPPGLKQLPNDAILVVRVEQSDTHWMQPGDLRADQLSPSEETQHLLLGKDGYVMLFADGEAWVLSEKTPLADLCKFFTLSGARQFNREELLGPYRILP